MLRGVFRLAGVLIGGASAILCPGIALAQSWFNPFAPPTYNPTTMVFGGATATPT